MAVESSLKMICLSSMTIIPGKWLLSTHEDQSEEILKYFNLEEYFSKHQENDIF
jgi:hypothetical protein